MKNYKTKYNIITSWKNNLYLTQKENQIIQLQNLIISIKEKGLLESLYIVINEKELRFNLLNNIVKNVKELSSEKHKIFYSRLENDIQVVSLNMLKCNPIIFLLELYIPKMYAITLKELIVWIYYVEIKESKLKKDKNKQYFYLIYEFQKENDLIKKEEILLNLLYKIQLYIKNAR